MNRIFYFLILPTKDTKIAKFHSFLFACFVGNIMRLYFLLIGWSGAHPIIMAPLLVQSSPPPTAAIGGFRFWLQAMNQPRAHATKYPLKMYVIKMHFHPQKTWHCFNNYLVYRRNPLKNSLIWLLGHIMNVNHRRNWWKFRHHVWTAASLLIGNGFVTNEQSLFKHPGSSQLTDHCATSHRGGNHLCCQAMTEFCLANLNGVWRNLKSHYTGCLRSSLSLLNFCS